jgi:hypothetical protein
MDCHIAAMIARIGPMAGTIGVAQQLIGPTKSELTTLGRSIFTLELYLVFTKENSFHRRPSIPTVDL